MRAVLKMIGIRSSLPWEEFELKFVFNMQILFDGGQVRIRS